MNAIHIYGQQQEHDEVFIMGDIESLTNLCKLIINAIALDKPFKRDFFASDGEGYTIIVSPQTDLSGFPRHYTENESWPGERNPWTKEQLEKMRELFNSAEEAKA